ncbi:MAG: 50S ribosomal protein L32 [Nitrospinota bacterium]
MMVSGQHRGSAMAAELSPQFVYCPSCGERKCPGVACPSCHRE